MSRVGEHSGRHARIGVPAGDNEGRDGLPRSASIFLRGLSIGALIGAAIAGSTIWERRRTRRRGDGTGSPVAGTGVDDVSRPAQRT
jgi:hypothetical protein